MVQAGPGSQHVKQIGDYAIVRVIGEGGMGIVYEATERPSGKRVALKVLHSSLARADEARRRFFGEMKILGELQHPNIVRSIGNAEIEGKLVIVLEYLEGHTLRTELERGALPPQRVIQIAIAVAAALAAAHGKQPPVVHRDLKPENIMLLGDGGVKVMDFGVAKVLAGDATATQSTEVIGTPRYMSPEQIEARAITPRSDLYTLGILVYEMLTGVAPFQSDSLLQVIRDQCDKPPPPLPETIRHAIPAELENLTFAMLQKVPEKRPPHARAALQSLQRCWAALPSSGRSAVAAPAVTPPPRASMPSPRARPSKANPKRLDTIQLMDRFESKRRWPLIAVGFVLCMVAAVVTTWIVATRSQTKSASAASASASAKVACKNADVCKDFAPADPTKVDADALIKDVTAFAQSHDENAKLAAVMFHNVLGNGVLDLTRREPTISLTFDLPEGGLNVEVRKDAFLLRKYPNEQPLPPLPEVLCTFKQAWDVAAQRSFPFDAESDAVLLGAQAELNWMMNSKANVIMIDARTCAVIRDSSRPELPLIPPINLPNPFPQGGSPPPQAPPPTAAPPPAPPPPVNQRQIDPVFGSPN